MNQMKIEKGFADSADLEKISRYTRRQMSSEELYIFNVTLCNNDVDRDFEKFSKESLYRMAELFVGKTGIFDHSMRSCDQKARIFDTFVEKQEGEYTSDGEPLYCLRAKAYMLKNEENKALIDEIDAGIKKEVSVSCSMASSVCSICGRESHSPECNHIKGKYYANRLCFSILGDARDAYEFSFVAVPAQREAGITKSFSAESGEEIVKKICSADDAITLSKGQLTELNSYIDELKEEACLGEEYKKQLASEVISLFALSFPDIDRALLKSVVSVMTSKELVGFRTAMRGSACTAEPQLASKNKNTKNENNFEFQI